MINNDIVFIHVCEHSAQRSRNLIRVQLIITSVFLWFKQTRSVYVLLSQTFATSAVELTKTCIRTNQSLQSQSILSYEEDYNAADIGGGFCQNM